MVFKILKMMNQNIISKVIGKYLYSYKMEMNKMKIKQLTVNRLIISKKILEKEEKIDKNLEVYFRMINNNNHKILHYITHKVVKIQKKKNKI